MINGLRVLALVPARSGSKGLPGKNIRVLGGKPLLTWPVAAALGSRYVDRVVMSTDSEEFAEIARRAGADVPFLRPADMASDAAPSIGFIRHAIDELEALGDRYDYLLLLEPTSPLTESSDVDSAIEALVAARDRADSIVGVTPHSAAHPAFAVVKRADGLLKPYLAPDFGSLPRRQDVEAVFALDGSLYASTIPALRRNSGFCHARTLPYVMPRWKSFEVDDLLDFVCIEAILANRDLLIANE